MQRIRLGILGCGRIVLGTHLPLLRARADVEIAALAEPDDQLRTTALDQAPAAKACRDWREVIARRDLEAVLVALPTGLHAEAAIAALAAGKHIYLEKPIAATLVDGRRVIGAWRQSDCIAATGFNYRYHPLVRALREEIRSGRIGDTVTLRCTFRTGSELPAWKQSRAAGGGALLDLASHHIDLLHYLLSAEVQSVSAQILSTQTEHDTAALDLQLSGGIAAQLSVSLSGGEENRIDIAGSRGKLSVDCYRSAGVEPNGTRASSPHRAAALLGAALFGSNMKRSYQQSLDTFLAAVRRGRQPECDLYTGLASLAVIDAAERSAAIGAAVTPERIAPVAACDLPAGSDEVPRLSVAAVTMDCYETIRETVRYLAAQTIHDKIELLICAPSAAALGLDDQEMRPFHSFRILAGGNGAMSAARISAVHAARAPLVVFAEDHSFPEPEWAEQLVAAHAQGAAAVAPQMGNANPRTMMSWADLFVSFAPWVEPRPHGPAARLPWHNTAYDTATLRAMGAELEGLIEHEGLLHERLQTAGKRMVLVQAKTRHVNVTRFPSFWRLHYHGGRAFGASRAAHGRWTAGQRLVHVAGSPLVPLVRLRSIWKDAQQCGRASLVPRMLPWLILGLCCHAAGEALGIAWGASDSGRLKSDLEFHRERHISDADAAKLGFRRLTPDS